MFFYIRTYKKSNKNKTNGTFNLFVELNYQSGLMEVAAILRESQGVH